MNHLDSVSKSLATRNLIEAMSYQILWNVFLFCFFENHEIWHFSKDDRFTEFWLESFLPGKASLKYIPANAESTGFKLSCNVHVWALFDKLPVFGKSFFFTKKAHGLI